MVTLDFCADGQRTIEVITREEMVGKLYSILLTSKRCSAIHAYSGGIELNLETNDILDKMKE